jgi:anti-sigma B factor antagonist
MENIAELSVVSEARSRSCVVVDLSGELDVASVPDLRHKLTTLIASGHIELVLNAGALEFIDAAGLGCLVHAANLARDAGGWVRLIRVRQRHRRLLLILGLGRTLPIYQDLADALREA